MFHWLAENCLFIPERTVRRYMEFYNKVISNRSLVTDLARMPITEAYRELGSLRGYRPRGYVLPRRANLISHFAISSLATRMKSTLTRFASSFNCSIAGLISVSMRTLVATIPSINFCPCRVMLLPSTKNNNDAGFNKLYRIAKSNRRTRKETG